MFRLNGNRFERLPHTVRGNADEMLAYMTTIIGLALAVLVLLHNWILR